jgi:ATP-dependent helicase/nuclease subunit B
LAFHVLFGEHANELIDECLGRISAEARLWPQKRAFLLVPEPIKADMEKRLLQFLKKTDQGSQVPFEALMMVDVVSFSRLSHRVLSEVGGISEDFMDDALETMLIHTILKEGGKDFSELSALSDRIGFVPEIQNVLGDFLRYHVTADRLREIDSGSVEPKLAMKIRDFALLMERLEAKTQDLGYVRAGEGMKRLADILQRLSGKSPLAWPLNRLSYLREASVWILGFGQHRDFTPEEFLVLSGLAGTCESLTMTVVSDRIPVTKTEITDGAPAFTYGRQTLWSIRNRFPNASMDKRTTSPDKPEELLLLSGAFASRSITSSGIPAPAILPMLMPNSMDELTFVAGEIRRLVLCEGLRYKDISVVLCDPVSSESNLHAVFSEFGLDPFLDKRRPLSGTALIRFLMSLLDLGISGWSFPSLMTCLKSGMCHVPPQDVDLFENYCMRYGLFRGYRIFDEKNYTENNDPDRAMLSIMRRSLLPLREFIGQLCSALTCSDKAQTLLSFLSAYGGEADGYLPGVAGQVEALSSEWAQAGDQDAALALTISFNELVVLLEKLSGPIGDTQMSLLNFKSLLLSGMDAAFYGAIPSYVDQITISDIKRGALRSSRVIFLVGACSDRFPFGNTREGYLRGFERERISESLGIYFPSRSRDQYYSDYAVAYSLLDAPTQRLYVLCPQSKEPSVIFSQIHELFGDSKRPVIPTYSMHDARLFSKNTLQRYIRARMAESNESAEGELLLAMAQQIPGLLTEAVRQQMFDIQISEETMRRRYPGELRMSVSQVETYASCPFKHFGNYVLRLKERDLYESRADITGTILHAVMENALKEYMDRFRKVGSQEEREKLYDEYASRDFSQWGKRLIEEIQDVSDEPVAGDSVFRASAGSIMRRTAGHTLRYIFNDSSIRIFEPGALEWKFGEECTPQISIPTNSGRDVLLKGTIDRVDIDPSGHSFRVIDYKTGNKEVKYDELYHGLSVQLPVYLKVFSSYRKDLAPAQAGYFLVARPNIDLSGSGGLKDSVVFQEKINKSFKVREIDMDPSLLQKTADHAIEKIQEHCNSLFSGDFSVRPRKLPKGKVGQACEYCDYVAVCGIDPKTPPVKILSNLPDVTDAKQNRDRENFKMYLQNHFQDGRDMPS